jgi:ankyrin repeat protein
MSWHESIVQLLLERGAKVDNERVKGCSNALYAALYNGDEAIVMQLLKKSADVSAEC